MQGDCYIPNTIIISVEIDVEKVKNTYLINLKKVIFCAINVISVLRSIRKTAYGNLPGVHSATFKNLSRLLQVQPPKTHKNIIFNYNKLKLNHNCSC